MIRAAWVLIAGVFLTGFYSSRVLINHWLKRKDFTCRCDALTRRWCHLVLRVAGVELAVEGAERVDWRRPSVVIANHQSWFDVFALAAALPGRVRFVAKEELGRIPIFGTAWHACGHIAIDRSDRRAAIQSLDTAAQWVRDNSMTMLLFPEGTRSPDGKLQEFKKGAFVLATKTGLPIVPVGISGSRDVMPKGSFRIRPGWIRVRVGNPIVPRDNWEDAGDDLRTYSRNAVAALIDDREPSGQDLPHDQTTETRE